MIGLMVCGWASGQYFEPPPMDPDPIGAVSEASRDTVGKSRVAAPPAQDETYDPAVIVPTDQTQVAVLGYHNFSNSKPVTEMLMRTTEFREQMETIRKLKLRVISMQEFCDWRQGKLRLPARCILITLDDGWKSVYTDAFPVLKEYGYPFTLFLYTKYLSGHGDSMTPEMIREMQAHGATVGSHSTSHYYPSRWKHAEAQGKDFFRAFMDVEMGDSQKKLSELFGVINTYCYPGGFVTPAIVESLPGYGYVAAFTVIPGKVHADEDMMRIHRYMVFGTDSSIFQRAVNFGKGDGSALKISKKSSGSLPPFPVFPAAGSKVSEDLEQISAQLGTIENLDFSSVQMRVSGFGRVPAQLDPAARVVQWKLPMRIYMPSLTVQLSWKTVDGKRMNTQWSFDIIPAKQTENP